MKKNIMFCVFGILIMAASMSRLEASDKSFCRNYVVVFAQTPDTLVMEEDGSIDLWGPYFQGKTVLKIRESQSRGIFKEGSYTEKLIEIGKTDCTFAYEERGFNINTGDSLPFKGNFTVKFSPEIFASIFYGDSEKFNSFLSQITDVNARDCYDRTSLMLACFYGRQDMVKVLLERGVDVNLKDKQDHTALMMAIKYPQILQLIISKKPDINAADVDSRTALYFAIYKKVSDESLSILFSNGADIKLVEKIWPFSIYGFKEDEARIRRIMQDVSKK